ncbi:MAG: ribonuclease PH [Planctomycetes bacterium]|nr:ribonuclease PH [Planctomycetota bacterium]
MRQDGRRESEIRPLQLQRNFTGRSPGSVLIRAGQTHLLCTASVEEAVPKFLSDAGHGWVTAEYGMLPGSTPERRAREERRGRTDGRTLEIQRLIGRSVRAVVDLTALGRRTVWLDCDVLKADGGTRTMAVNGACIALADALEDLRRRGVLATDPLRARVAAVSVGLVDGQVLVDMDASEDQRARWDMNVVMTDDARLVEVQGTAEGEPIEAERLEELLAAAGDGVGQVLAARHQALLADAAGAAARDS